MNIDINVLKSEEAAAYKLRALYRSFGYKQFKMNKFEEYEFYLNNKDFLVSDNVITFNDTDSRLMALKPDVTLSIIKNADNSGDIRRVFYNENVYRISQRTHSFKEIMQTGLECIGRLDSLLISEVLLLAAESLECIGGEYLLELSNMAIISGLTENLPGAVKSEIVKFIGEKNLHGVKSVCEKNAVDEGLCDLICRVASIHGKPEDVLCELKQMNISSAANAAVDELDEVCRVLKENGADNLIIDFSIVNNMNYYSGIVFRGYIKGIPTGVLSGGRYDGLMHKMGKKCGAIGFAVYLDELERYNAIMPEYDVETVLLYNDTDNIGEVLKALKKLKSESKTVAAYKQIPQGLKYKEKIVFGKEAAQ